MEFSLDITGWYLVSEVGLPPDGMWCFVVFGDNEHGYTWSVGGYSTETGNFWSSMGDGGMVYPHEGAVQAGLFIDCIWFQNGRLMPAIMEVEHSTGVTSGLTRMLNFYEKLPKFETRYVIVAPDDDRQHVVKEASKEIFKRLNALYFPYSAVEELYYLCEKRNLNRQNVTEEFLDCFMEKAAIAL